jgi:hypothetical protein
MHSLGGILFLDNSECTSGELSIRKRSKNEIRTKLFSEMQGCGLPANFPSRRFGFGDVCPSCCVSRSILSANVQSTESTIAELTETFILLPKTSAV